MAARQTYSLDEIKDMLLARIDQVVDQYAPAAPGSYTDKGKYFTLNPGRADRHVGSFCVNMKTGKWNDYATAEFGDLIDLIALYLGCDLKSALREARSFLGLQSDSPEDVARRKQAVEDGKARRREAAAKDREYRERAAKQAHAIWLSGQAALRGTPVDHYLRDARGIDLSRLGRQPGVLRYLPECYYKHTDPETGEVFEGKWPAMVALVQDAQGKPIACHRTYLGMDAQGRWGKADLPETKKVLGRYGGGYISIWKGEGPRGGKPASLTQAPAGQHVYIAEGIEDALSAVLLMPSERVLAGISLSNLGSIELPSSVSTITLIADRDESPDAQEALQRAIATHQAAGRDVRLFLNRWGGKDLNDALRAAHKKDQGAA